MQIVGVTGGIATGKTTVIEYLRSKGYATIDCDALSRGLSVRGTRGYAEILEEFGDKYVCKHSGELDRFQLGRTVFRKPAMRKKLEKILHPKVFRAICRQVLLYYLAGRRVVFIDVPLLFECKWERYFRHIIVVTCGPKTQQERLAARTEKSFETTLQKRGGVEHTKEEATKVYMSIVETQYPMSKKRKQASIVIDNNRPLRETYKHVDLSIDLCVPGIVSHFFAYVLPLLVLLSLLILGGSFAKDREKTAQAIQEGAHTVAKSRLVQKAAITSQRLVDGLRGLRSRWK